LSAVRRRTTGTVAVAVAETGDRKLVVCSTDVTADTTAGDAAVGDVTAIDTGRMSTPDGERSVTCGDVVEGTGADISNLVPGGTPIVTEEPLVPLKLTVWWENSAAGARGKTMRAGG